MRNSFHRSSAAAALLLAVVLLPDILLLVYREVWWNVGVAWAGASGALRIIGSERAPRTLRPIKASSKADDRCPRRRYSGVGSVNSLPNVSRSPTRFAQSEKLNRVTSAFSRQDPRVLPGWLPA